MRMAGWSPEQVDYINAHGTSTGLNDKMDSLMVRKVFGERAKDVVVTSTKSMIGHCLGAAGALETIASFQAIEQGYIQAGQGRRMRVIYQPTAQNEFMIGGIESFREAAARNHFQAVTRVVHFAEDVVDQKTAQKTGLPLGSDIYDVRRIRYLEGKALILDINLFLREAVPNLTPEIAAHSIYDYIENVLGMTIVTSRRRMTVERAGALDMRWLEMGDYNCLAVVSGRTYNAEGIQFEYTQSRHHPEYFCFEDTAVRRNVR